LAAAAGCVATTGLTNTWTDPAARTTPMQKVAVVYLTPDEGMRQIAETEAARQIIQGARLVPSYQVLSASDLRDRELVRAKLREQDFDGVLVMRPAAVAEQFSPVAAPYGTFSAYYDWAGIRVFTPGFLPSDAVVHVISNLYSLRDDKLVWSGTSRSYDPSWTAGDVSNVSRAVARRIQVDRLII
jgi:hypothetical protein